MVLTIRPATALDVPLILDFIRALALYERAAAEVVADEERLRETLFGESPQAKVVLALWEGRPVGFAVYFFSYSTWLARKGLYLEDLFVLPEARGNGVGKALLRQLARIAVEEGCGRLEWSVLDWNQPAIDFYLSLGAVPQSEWTRYRLSGTDLQELAGTGES
ncbi:MAG: GNAT family N-acetyltransferase [Pseudohongiellaceae bacterium]